MPPRRKLDELLDWLDPEALQADGFEDCILGVAERCGSPNLLAYDVRKIIKRLMKDGMSEEEAEEYFSFNIAGAYVGEGTPIFIHT